MKQRRQIYKMSLQDKANMKEFISHTNNEHF